MTYTGECSITIRYADKRRIPAVVREIAESLERDQVRQDSAEWSCSIRDYPKETPIPVNSTPANFASPIQRAIAESMPEPNHLPRDEAPGIAAMDVQVIDGETA